MLLRLGVQPSHHARAEVKTPVKPFEYHGKVVPRGLRSHPQYNLERCEGVYF